MEHILLTQSWSFTKAQGDYSAKPIPPETAEMVQLPHTWNNLDGQDGGSDYHRGTCWYQTKLPQLDPSKTHFIQFEGANHIATVYLDGKELGTHEGGFSTFRFALPPITDEKEGHLAVKVFNGKSHVYPQAADFTFFGGIYRPASLLSVSESHFDLMYYGSDGIFITATPYDTKATVKIDSRVVLPEGCSVHCNIRNPQGEVVAELTQTAQETVTMVAELEDIQRWDGLKNPALYTVEMTLEKEDTILDCRNIPFGIRDFVVSPADGFFLNGQSYPLRGVSRHQDRMDKGWAISEKDHKDDLSLIGEMGANSIRLAHYQHSQAFYDLCDEAGMVLWAEIPFISMFDDSPEAIENTYSQMRELVLQNYNHPAVCFWGIANEISIAGNSPALEGNLRGLEELVKKLDSTRLTAIANMTVVGMDSPHNTITDLVGYNHYFGWYMGDVSQNGPWLDAFHEAYPDIPLGLTEYGAEGILQWHTETPENQDYTEEYHAYYHEKMLETFATRPYLWGTYVWNMFDFAADSRNEGGMQGRNNKGMVSYDRSIKKDAYFIYKAYWSSEPFVHLCGRRFERRMSGTTLKIYSNQPEITVEVNGKVIGTQTAEKIFSFSDVALELGENKIVARSADGHQDTMTLIGAPQADPSYILPREAAKEGVENWFEALREEGIDFQTPEGQFSLKDTLGQVMAHPQARELILGALPKEALGGIALGDEMMNMVVQMMGDRPLQSLFTMMTDDVDVDGLLALNQELNKISKE